MVKLVLYCDDGKLVADSLSDWKPVELWTNECMNNERHSGLLERAAF